MAASSVVQMRQLGAVQSHEADARGVTIQCDGGVLRLSVVAANVVRVRVAFGGEFVPRRAWAVNRDDAEWEVVQFSTNATDDALILKTESFTLPVARADAAVTLQDSTGRLLCADTGTAQQQANGALSLTKQLDDDEHIYGCGERSGLLDKRGRICTNWTVDPWLDHSDHGPGTDNMYHAIPFYMALREGERVGYGLYLNNSYRSAFDFGATHAQALGIRADDGELDYYLIVGDPAAIVEGYTAITGRMGLPPAWALGYQQCRWSYMSSDIVRDVARQFRERQIPCDTIVLDIDYMRGWRVFTWNPDAFGDHEALVAELTAQGFKVVTIIDPGVKYDQNSGYPVFDTGKEIAGFIKTAAGDDWRGCVWPGDCAFPDFSRSAVRQWWGDLNGAWVGQGIAGIWNDMNEPAVHDRPFGYVGERNTDIPPDAPQGDDGETTWAETHNLYGYLEDWATYDGLRKAQPDARPFVLTRSGFAGIQKYSAVWAGDNSSYWEHLEMSLPQLANLSMSGVAFVGCDIGGFGGNASGELFARWIQLGAFYPFARGHSAIGTQQHEPWVFGEDVEAISRRYIELRYRLLPYFYTHFMNATRTGAPVWRPLFYDFPEDRAVIALHDQVMVGDALMVAPVYRPNQEFRHVYLPAGVWYNYWTGERYDGPVHILAHAPLDTLPLFTRGGTVIPHAPKMQYTGEKPIDSIRYTINPDAQGNATGRFYEDDGHSQAYTRGDFAYTTITCTRDANGTHIIHAAREGAYAIPSRVIRVRVYGIPASHATVNGQDAAITQTDDGALMVEVGDDTGTWEVSIAG